ncbi:MAG: WYL domain-containing protein [Erysipelotrichia bacterium]|nr:WYL domain-containing protein [Erysipelotrichia bacterium]
MPKVERPSNNSKWERINTIYELLRQSCEGMSIQDLSQQMNVSTKTIQRDLYEVLGEYGAVKQGRMWKLDSKKAEDNLNSNERIILGILDEMAKNAGNSFYGKAHSLLKQVSQQLEHPIFANVESESLDENHIELFSLLEKAIKARHTVGFNYKKHPFDVQPLKLAFFDGFWYLLALDINDDNKFKKFYLKAINNLTIQNNIFLINTMLEERLKKANSIWFDLDKELFDVHLLIDKEIMTYFERKPLKGQSVVGKDLDGSCEVIIPITHEMEIIPLIFWYMPHIKVLEPTWLADNVKNKTREYLQSL